MKILALVLIIYLSVGCCSAENALEFADTALLEDFAERRAQIDIEGMIRSAAAGESDLSVLAETVKQWIDRPFQDVIACMGVLIAPALLLAVLGCAAGKGAGAARFLAMLGLLSGLAESALPAFKAAQDCLEIAAEFSDAVVPALAGLLTAAGMTNSAALLSPAAALAAGIAENYFLSWGLPLCRYTLAVALAGSLLNGMDLLQLCRFMRKIVAWGVGLCFTLFTAIVALQGGMGVSLDGVAVKTAKYAVDSAAPLIGSGVSDAWESYVSGIQVARSAVGISGTLVLLLAALKPLLQMLGSMLAMHVLSIMLDVFGEKQAARAAEQCAGVCQMALELSTGGLAIATILLGAAVSTGRNLLG